MLKALLDTSFLRHLESINGVGLISVMTKKLEWEFKIPQIVVNELNRGTTGNHLRTIMSEGIIQIDSCTEKEFSLIRQSLLGLDDGELEAICIVNKCDDRKFKEYLILTDDRPAQRKAFQIGMSSLDVVTFLFFANQKGCLEKELAMNSLEILKKQGYSVDKLVQSDFEKRLI